MITEFKIFENKLYMTDLNIGDILEYNGKNLELHGQPVKIIKKGHTMPSLINVVTIEFLFRNIRKYIDIKYLKKLSPDKLKEIEDKRNQMKLKMIDVDPYGEEDWEFNENVNFQQFEFGDRVEYNANFTYIINWKKGTVIKVEDDGWYLVKFDEKWTGLHDGNGEDPTEMSFWCLSMYLRKEVKREQRFNEDDPYGEEEWEINEKINRPKIKLGKYKVDYYIGRLAAKILMKIVDLIIFITKDDAKKEEFLLVKEENSLLFKSIKKFVNFFNKRKINKMLTNLEKIRYDSLKQDECNSIIKNINNEYKEKYGENIIPDLIKFIKLLNEYDDVLELKKEISEVKDLMRKIRVDDPYGEEDWEE